MTRSPGRPKIGDTQEGALEKIQVKMVPSEKIKLDRRVKDSGGTISSVVRGALKRERLIEKYLDEEGGLTVIDPASGTKVIIYL